MSELEKLKKRLKSLPRDFTYNEAKTLLTKLGFKEDNKGRTSGSRVQFEKEKDKLFFHKSHPQNILDPAVVRYLLRELTRTGDIK